MQQTLRIAHTDAPSSFVMRDSAHDPQALSDALRASHAVFMVIASAHRPLNMIDGLGRHWRISTLDDVVRDQTVITVDIEVFPYAPGGPASVRFNRSVNRFALHQMFQDLGSERDIVAHLFRELHQMDDEELVRHNAALKGGRERTHTMLSGRVEVEVEPLTPPRQQVSRPEYEGSW